MRELLESRSKEKEKGEDVDKIMYTCVVDKIQEKKKKGKGNVRRKKKAKYQKLQYFYNKF